jgi:hypothetical protein
MYGSDHHDRPARRYGRDYSIRYGRRELRGVLFEWKRNRCGGFGRKR